MDICYIYEPTKTVFMRTEAGYAAYNVATGEFDIMIKKPQAWEMMNVAKRVPIYQGKDYALNAAVQHQQSVNR